MDRVKRQFLCGNTGWRGFVEQQDAIGIQVLKGYLSVDPERIVSVTLESVHGKDTQATLDISGTGSAGHEYLIPLYEARDILTKSCLKPLITKDRYCISTEPQRAVWVPHRNNERQSWNLDIYHDVNEGLVINEVELLSKEDEIFAMPWVGEEITKNEEYREINLVLKSYNQSPASKLEGAMYMGTPIIPGR